MVQTGLFWDADDLHSMALCAWREARGEGEDGMRAVLNVIRNRAASWYSHSRHPIHEAVYAKNQFSSMSIPNDQQFNLQPHLYDPEMGFCMQTARAILNGDDADPTKGALYYRNPRTATSIWFQRAIVDKPNEHPHLATIGNHEFYA